MPTLLPRWTLLLLALCTPLAPQGGGADPSDDAFRMGSPPSLPAGTTEQEMWPAATAEGWRKPCLVTWQRSFDDALAVAQAERRPVLVAVNMDGEIASEHFAGVRYRQPETAALLNEYVCVVASVYRHTPRDYDELGRRVECPRFQTVTCGEHIQAERDLYETYFDGTRVAPRHIVLEPGGEETYDVYYAWDTVSVVETFRKGIVGYEPLPPPTERTLADLARSTDVDDRETLERTYREGDRETRRRLLEIQLRPQAVDQVELLRAAIFGFDLELARLARRALAQCESEAALDLIAEALKVPLEPDEKQLLLDAVERMGRTSRRARTLAALHGGLTTASSFVDAGALREEYAATARSRVDVAARAEAALARPDEPGALLDLAEALYARSRESSGDRYARLFLEDACAAAREAERLGASGPRLDAALAVAASARGERREARERAVAAVEGGLLEARPAQAEDAAGGALTARVLALFGEARRQAIRRAYRENGQWPAEWLADVNGVYETLSAGPFADEELFVDHQDFLRWIGATPRANAVLDEALARFPDSAVLHERLRGRLLWEGGPDGLEEGYAERLERAAEAGSEDGQLRWYAGYASLVAAEHHRRRGQLAAALAAYERGIALYERHAARFPDLADDAAHYVTLALAGEARVALEREELDSATRLTLASLARRPASAASLDGLGITPLATARMLQARLRQAGDEERATRVQEVLEELDPTLLEPPSSERGLRSGAGRGPTRSG